MIVLSFPKGANLLLVNEPTNNPYVVTHAVL